MAADVNSFAAGAKGLARNPLGIIALFIVLIYGCAGLVTGLTNFEGNAQTPLVWFLVIFPFAVLGVFAWLVSCHHKKLYAPSDFDNQEHFVSIARPEMLQLDYVDREAPEETLPAEESSAESISSAFETASPTSYNASVLPITRRQWSLHRDGIYRDQRGYFVAHILEPTRKHDQEFDIFIFLVKHKSEDHSDIKSAEFFFGKYWNNKVFKGSKIGNYIGIRTSAYGPFLCTCKITFSDDSTSMVYRYIDFEMGHALTSR